MVNVLDFAVELGGLGSIPTLQQNFVGQSVVFKDLRIYRNKFVLDIKLAVALVF